MRFAKIAAAAAVATCATAEQTPYTNEFEQYLAETPMVEESTYFPINGWGVTDWVAGLLIGAYTPLQIAWRNDDCRSQWFSLGVDLMSYSKEFNTPFEVANPMTWVSMVLNLALTGLNTYNLVYSCSNQYAEILAGDDWYLDFNLAADVDGDDTEDSGPIMVGNWTLTKTIIKSIMIAIKTWFIYKGIKSEYYYFFWAKALGDWIVSVFMAIDAWGQFDIIVPTDPWILYNAQVA